MIDLLARDFDVQVAAATATTEGPLHCHRLSLGRDRFAPMPPMKSAANGFAKVRPCMRAIAEIEARSDVVLVQLPFPAPLALVRPHRPRVYHVCADVLSIVRTSPSYRGLRRPLAVGMATGIHVLERWLVDRPHTRAVANGRDLYDRLGVKAGRYVVSSGLRAVEIGAATRQRAGAAPFRVLFVGYPRPEKGLDLLLDSFEAVLERRPNAELFIVGARDSTDHGMSEGLRRSLDRLSRGGAVRFAGELGFGPELFQVFADGDVLAVPSRSEGTPRVLIEARAFGCPVVATSVGGIPTSVTDGVDGLLVPPEDPDALAGALLRVAEDEALRERLVFNGFARARANTVETFVGQIAEEVRLAGTRES